MAKYKPVYPFDQLHGKYATGSNVSYRTTFGTRHTYILQHPYEGPASPAQSSMREAWGVACKYASTILRDPAARAEWTERCKGTRYNRPDRYCVAESYREFKADPAKLEAAKALIAQVAAADAAAKSAAKQG